MTCWVSITDQTMAVTQWRLMWISESPLPLSFIWYHSVLGFRWAWCHLVTLLWRTGENCEKKSAETREADGAWCAPGDVKATGRPWTSCSLMERAWITALVTSRPEAYIAGPGLRILSHCHTAPPNNWGIGKVPSLSDSVSSSIKWNTITLFCW